MTQRPQRKLLSTLVCLAGLGITSNVSAASNAFNTIEAENYLAMSGIGVWPGGTGKRIGSIENGTWAKYRIDFGSGASGMTISASSASSGGNLEIRLDSLNGPLKGTISLGHTGGWSNFKTVNDFTETISGVHDVYFVFKGSNQYLFDIDYFVFKKAPVQAPVVVENNDNTNNIVASTPNSRAPYTYEAEDYSYKLHSSYRTDQSWWSGTGFMDMYQAPNAFIKWDNVQINDDGVYNLHFTYANGSSQKRNANLFVNGEFITEIDFAPSGSWSTTATDTVSLQLGSGSHSIMVQANNPNGGPDLDKMTLGQATAASYEAEDYSNKSYSSFRTDGTWWGGTGFMDMYKSPNASLEWSNIEAVADGSYKLTFSYANGSDYNRNAQVFVNGSQAATVEFPPTGSWSTVGNNTVSVELYQGANTISLQANNPNGGPDLDKLTVSNASSGFVIDNTNNTGNTGVTPPITDDDPADNLPDDLPDEPVYIPPEEPSYSNDFELAMHGWAVCGRTVAQWEGILNRKVDYVSEKIGSEVLGFWQMFLQSQRDRLTLKSQRFPNAKLAIILDIYPNSVQEGPEFKNVANGMYDEDLKKLARLIIDTGHPDAVLRLYHEFDLPFRKWYEDPHFIPAWRRVHQVMSSVPGAKFGWQYNFNGIGSAQGRAANGQYVIEKAWPGKAYVTEVGVSLYDRAPLYTVEGRANFSLNFAKSKGVPFSWAEGGLWQSNPDGTNGNNDNPSYIKFRHNFFSSIPKHQRGYLMYFETVDFTDTGSCLSAYPNSDRVFQNLYSN